MVDDDARQVFDSLVRIVVGKGDKVLFWRDRWIHRFVVHDIAPSIADRVDTRKRNKRTVEQAMMNEHWLTDFQADNSFTELLQVMHRDCLGPEKR